MRKVTAITSPFGEKRHFKNEEQIKKAREKRKLLYRSGQSKKNDRKKEKKERKNEK